MKISKEMYRKMIRLNKLAFESLVLENEVVEYLKSIGIDTEEANTEEHIANYLIYGSAKKTEVDELLKILKLEV